MLAQNHVATFCEKLFERSKELTLIRTSSLRAYVNNPTFFGICTHRDPLKMNAAHTSPWIWELESTFQLLLYNSVKIAINPVNLIVYAHMI
jgi:hypothetical protein